MIGIPAGLLLVVALYIFRRTRIPKHRLRDRYREIRKEDDGEASINQFEPGGKLHHFVSQNDQTPDRP